jgi:hypothetical protein
MPPRSPTPGPPGRPPCAAPSATSPPSTGTSSCSSKDDSLVKHDQAVLFRAVRDAGVADTLAYEHLPARSEPLLWIADAAAWCWSHDRPCGQDHVSPVVRTVTPV